MQGPAQPFGGVSPKNRYDRRKTASEFYAKTEIAESESEYNQSVTLAKSKAKVVWSLVDAGVTWEDPIVPGPEAEEGKQIGSTE